MDLESHQFISFFAPEQAAQLCRVAIIEDLVAGSIIFDEGDLSDSLYLLLDGQVVIRKRLDSDEYKNLTQVDTNGFFGEMGILDGQPRSAQAIVFKEVTLARIPASKFMEILDSIKGSEAIKVFSYMAQRLRESTEEIIHKTKMESVGELVNTIVHDFRSPLSSINLASSMIKEQHPDEDTVEWCDMIRDQVNRMLSMAEEFLEFSRGERALNREPIDLGETLELFRRWNQDLPQANVKLEIECPENLTIAADKYKLTRVWQNLINNAVEAFKQGGGCIQIRVEANESWVKMSLRDNGPGIPERIRETLFEPFVTYGKGGGTGLGTAIAKSIVEAHGGTISFESGTKIGTTFFIRLPRHASTKTTIGNGEATV
jgi:signal transduction histidine kinase